MEIAVLEHLTWESSKTLRTTYTGSTRLGIKKMARETLFNKLKKKKKFLTTKF